MTQKPIVVQVVGFKNRGKTTLVSRLVSTLKERGNQVGTIKGTGHFDMDQPGTDTWQHQEAGADIVSITSGKQTATLEQRSKTIDELLENMTHLDFVVIEGFKSASYPKVVVIKEEADQDLLEKLDHVVGVASWEAQTDTSFPVRHIDDVEGILEMLIGEGR